MTPILAAISAILEEYYLQDNIHVTLSMAVGHLQRCQELIAIRKLKCEKEPVGKEKADSTLAWQHWGSLRTLEVVSYGTPTTSAIHCLSIARRVQKEWIHILAAICSKRSLYVPKLIRLAHNFHTIPQSITQEAAVEVAERAQ